MCFPSRFRRGSLGEIRILHLRPDGGRITPSQSLVWLCRGGVDHNRNRELVGDTAAIITAAIITAG